MYSSNVTAIQDTAERVLRGHASAKLHSMWVDSAKRSLAIHAYCDLDATPQDKARVGTLTSEIARELRYIYGETWSVAEELHDLPANQSPADHEIALFQRQ